MLHKAVRISQNIAVEPLDWRVQSHLSSWNARAGFLRKLVRKCSARQAMMLKLPVEETKRDVRQEVDVFCQPVRCCRLACRPNH